MSRSTRVLSRRGWSRSLLRISVSAVALLVPLFGWVQDEGPRSIEVVFSPHGTIQWERGAHPVLLVEPMRGDGWITLARRYTGSSGTAGDLRSANPGMNSPVRDRWIRVPLELLRPEIRLEAMRTVFPADVRTVDGWRHWVLDPFGGGEESWRWLATVFVGSADHSQDLAQYNPGQPRAGPQRGRPVVIPESLLLPVFRRVAPVVMPTPKAPASTPPSPVPTGSLTHRAQPAAGLLEYGTDEFGSFAVYRLRRGEALYSAVVVRFTGQLLAKQVNETAMEIAARSGIVDVTDISVGYPVKIPFDLLLPEYLPADDPRRRAWVEERRELRQFLEVVDAANLSGVQIVLDAGHGGKDSGAVSNGIWESTYAYDIMCRIKANLERHTRATVWTTIQDATIGFSVPASDRLVQRRDAFLLTRPRYRLEDSVLGVHLRWYLTNDIILNRVGPSVPRSKTVFLSIHADSLHPAVRGAMVYVPSRYLRPDKPYTVRRRDIQTYAEYRNHPTVRLGTNFKARVEASSRHLAQGILTSLEDNDIKVHPYEPIRDRVLRGRRSWVPAVLRYTAAQNAVLLEVCNMANPEDRELMLQSQWREEFARAVVGGMAAAFAQ